MQARPKEDGHRERKDTATPPGILKDISSYRRSGRSMILEFWVKLILPVQCSSKKMQI